MTSKNAKITKMKDIKIPVEYIESGTFCGGEEDCVGLKNLEECFVVSTEYVNEKEEFRRIMREMLISMTCIQPFRSKAFNDGLRVLGLEESDLY